jgi:hypothetical protein
MSYSKTIQVSSFHTMFVEQIDKSVMPPFYCVDSYSTFYVVKNFNSTGRVFMYLAKGHSEGPNQIVVWYPNGQFWAGFGTNMKAAIEGAQRDGWMYAANVDHSLYK